MTSAGGRWVVVGRKDELSHGGSLRAHYLFRSLVERTEALSMYRPDIRALPAIVRKPTNMLPGANVAAAELIPGVALPMLRRLLRMRVLDLHDHPVLHAQALGLPLPADEARSQQRLTDANLAAFERVVVVSDLLGDLANVPPNQRIAIPNGTDTSLIEPGPWPLRPTIGLISAAAPGRGIELLIASARLVRERIPGLELRLCLSASEPASRSYLDALRRTLAADSWVEVAPAIAYARLGTFLAGCTVLGVPHPPGASWDAAPPVKLFDSMAAGRPIVATPRTETARILRETDSGAAAASDSIEDLANALATVLAADDRMRELGANARRAAEGRYDWRILSNALADAMLT
jgi:glycosyltransferase involved in cell wall biosynthesis